MHWSDFGTKIMRLCQIQQLYQVKIPTILNASSLKSFWIFYVNKHCVKHSDFNAKKRWKIKTSMLSLRQKSVYIRSVCQCLATDIGKHNRMWILWAYSTVNNWWPIRWNSIKNGAYQEQIAQHVIFVSFGAENICLNFTTCRMMEFRMNNSNPISRLQNEHPGYLQKCQAFTIVHKITTDIIST